jgi:hypothetical protein
MYVGAGISQSGKCLTVVLGDVMVIVLVIGPKVHSFKTGQERWIFKGNKNL